MDNKYDHSAYQKLKEALNFHNYRYHVLDDPVISDYEFDRMLVELREMEDHHAEWIAPDSPTQRSGAEPADKFDRVNHPVPILSLANAFNEDDIERWHARILKLDERIGESRFVLEPKIDGLTIVLHYHDGVLVRGATRGNGQVGEDITQNIRTIPSVPLKIPIKKANADVPENLVVRAETFITLNDFEKLNKELASRNEKTYQNPRNTAAGSLRMQDSKIVASRPLRILAYSIVSGNPKATQWESLEYLKALGFPTPAIAEKCENLSQMLACTHKWEGIREKLGYQIDGVVIKLDDLELADQLGIVGKDPRGAIALKFPAQEVTTVLKDIGVQVGRTGVLTPYAILEPVEIGGVLVKQATLHNFDFIADKDIRINDRVLVKRAGEVIPYIIGPIKDVRKGTEVQFSPPNICPSCGEKVEQVEGEVAWYCVNYACPAQIIRSIEHFVSRGAMDIVGIGFKIVEQLVAEGLIRDVADLYALESNDLKNLEGFAEKKAENIISAISASKDRPLSRLITALGIHGIGEVAAEALANRFTDLGKIAGATADQIMAIDGFGANTAASLEQWFSIDRNKQIVEKLCLYGVWPENESAQEQLPNIFNGKKFVITGTLQKFTREEIKKYIKDYGGKVSNNVSNKTDYLILGEDAGSKLEKARSLGVDIISEADLVKMVKTGK